MSIVARGSLDRPPALGSPSSLLPSGDCCDVFQFGDFKSTDIATSQAPGIGLEDKLNYNSANSDDFADQRPTSDAPSTPARRSPVRKEGPTTQVTPPYKARSASASAPASPRNKKGDLRSFAASDLAPRGSSPPGKKEDSAPLLRFGSEKGVHWSNEARSFYGIGDQKRLDKRDFKRGPQLQEEARVVAARLHHASNELQLRIESRRFETAQLQLQVQVEKTSTAKAQLAVEKARNRGRQLDIELELKRAGSTAAKSEADAARSAARLLDLDKQAALAAVKKEAAQLQLDGQQQRALSDADLQWEQQQTARAYIGLQTARLRNQQNKKAAAEVDTALIHLGVLPSLEAEWQCAFDCGFATADQTELEQHQAACHESTEHPGFFRSWNTGKWECDYCEFDANAEKFDEAAAEAHIGTCTYRHRGKVMYCDSCEAPMSVA